jgi:hypothetical protein
MQQFSKHTEATRRAIAAATRRSWDDPARRVKASHRMKRAAALVREEYTGLIKQVSREAVDYGRDN